MTPPANQRPAELWWVLVATFALGAALALWSHRDDDALAPRLLLDWQLRAAAPTAAPAGVLVLDIDDESLAALKPQLGTWPFKRDVYALAIEQLRDMGAQAIAIDLLLADAHEGDAALARAIARPGAPVVLAAAGVRHASDVASMQPAATTRSGTSPSALRAGVSPPALRWPAMTLPAETLWPAADRPPAWIGVITTPLDADGRLRRLPLNHAARGREWPAYPLAVLQAAGGSVSNAWPLDSQGRALVPFPAQASAEAPRLPFLRLAQLALGGAADAELAAAVRGRVVFIGSSALLADNVFTAGGQWRGTSVLAQAYAALRDGTLVRAAPGWTTALLVALALMPAALAAWRARVKPLADGALTLALAAAMAALAWGAARTRLELLALAAPLATLALGYAQLLAAHLRLSQRRERELAYESALSAAANRAKSEFLANVSHEIRTPMNAVLGVAELLAKSPLAADQRRHVEVLQQSGRSLLELIDDLLDLAKIEAGRMDFEPAPFELRPALSTLVALFEPRARGKGLGLVLDIAPDVAAAVKGDRRRIAQALTNLIGNAIKFTSQGEVRLEVRAAGGERIALTVADTGIGIAPSKHAAVFEPFMQADGSVTRRFGGTGLGLAITRRLVEMMGGTIELHSQPGAGSRFRIELPLPATAAADASGFATTTPPAAAAMPSEAPAAAPPRPTPMPAPAAPSQALAVLLAEDNPTNVYLFEAMLAKRAVRIDVAGDGHAALEQFARNRYDIVFLDVQMPGMDGHSAARAMRKLEAEAGRERTPIVALTAHAYAEDERASLMAGCDAHLTKPLAQATLLATLERLAWAAPHDSRFDSASLDVALTEPAELDDSVLDVQGALERLGGNRGIYRRTCEHAQIFLGTWGAAFEQALRNGDLAHAARLAHDAKGIARTVGAYELADTAGLLEAAVAGRPAYALDEALARSLADQVRSAIGPVMNALARRAQAGH